MLNGAISGLMMLLRLHCTGCSSTRNLRCVEAKIINFIYSEVGIDDIAKRKDNRKVLQALSASGSSIASLRISHAIISKFLQ